jgi:hypothetical protein
MANLFRTVAIGLVVVASGLHSGTSAQTPSPGGWMTPDWGMPAINNATRKPAPRRSLEGTWAPFGRFGGGTQAGGVQAKPNNGRPENALPYTPYGLALYKSHKALEGADAVKPADGNDPRNLCEPLGMPRTNHYNLGLTQIFQTEHKVALLYQYDNRWRVIWTDGRQLPTLAEGGVDIAGELREQRLFGYSVGRWLDDYTFEARTIGTMPEDRAWLDSTGRPISDQVRVTETFKRISLDELEWAETIDDPKIYSKPWETMRYIMRLHDPRTDIMEYYCSPVDQANYMKEFATSVSK